jgi:hypothetical protein
LLEANEVSLMLDESQANMTCTGKELPTPPLPSSDHIQKVRQDFTIQQVASLLRWNKHMQKVLE